MDIQILYDEMKASVSSPLFIEVVEKSRGKDIVIFLGNTRSGKSTTINRVIGNQMKAVKLRKNVFRIHKDDPDAPGPTIGKNVTSETTVPAVYTSKLLEELIVDAPGFDDNRGEHQDLANSFYIKEILKVANSVKFAVVIDMNEVVGDNIKLFIKSIDCLHTMLSDSDNIFKGMMIIFNKDKDGYSVSEVVELLTNITDQQELQIQNRALLTYFCANDNQLSTLPMPNDSGIIEVQEIDHVIKSIQKGIKPVCREDLEKVNPAISDSTKIFLLKSLQYMNEEQDFDDMMTKIETQFNNILEKFAATNDDTNNTIRMKKVELIKYRDEVILLTHDNTNFTAKFKRLENMLPEVSKEDFHSIIVKMDFVGFLDNILQTNQKGVIEQQFDKLFSILKRTCDEKDMEFQFRLNEIIKEDYEKKLDNMRKDHEVQLKHFEYMMQQQSVENANAIRALSDRLKAPASPPRRRCVIS